MKIAVFGISISSDTRPFVENLHRKLDDLGAEIMVYEKLHSFLEQHCNLNHKFKSFSSHEELVRYNPKFLITIGGDGTILDAVTFVRDSGVPILGINTGRLGFLANVNRDNIEAAIDALWNGDYEMDERYLLNLQADGLDMHLNFALNEVSVSRKDTTAMVTVHTWINDRYLNSYWADGLIIATPTGSTGYSLSCGGPIIMPGSDSLVITPIAPHNLNVRPFVIPNNMKIRLQVEGREDQFLVSLDSRIYPVDVGTDLFITLEKFKIRLVKTEIQDFADTLRNKLLWGLDRRN